MGEGKNERIAPEGAIWVCGACGKTARDSYGIEGAHSPGWDESCALNAILCHERQHVDTDGRMKWFAFSEPLPVSASPLSPEGRT